MTSTQKSVDKDNRVTVKCLYDGTFDGPGDMKVKCEPLGRNRVSVIVFDSNTGCELERYDDVMIRVPFWSRWRSTMGGIATIAKKLWDLIFGNEIKREIKRRKKKEAAAKKKTEIKRKKMEAACYLVRRLQEDVDRAERAAENRRESWDEWKEKHRVDPKPLDDNPYKE